MKRELNKKTHSFIMILLFFIIISCVNAAENNTTNTHTDILADVDNYQTNISHEITTKDDNTNKLKNNIKTEDKNTKKVNEVNNYNELYDKNRTNQENIKNTQETINLNPGNYNITKQINWGNITHTTKTLTINGNGIIVDGGKKYRFMTVENGYTLKLENITINNATATEGGVIYNKGNLEINNSKSIKTTIVDGKINITLPTDTLPEGEHNITLDVKENDDYTNNNRFHSSNS